jgi:hypothetical protein
MWSFIKICLICIIGIYRLKEKFHKKSPEYMLNYSLPCRRSNNLRSFWLTLKQQWTIKISSPLFLFLAWRPSWLEVGIIGHNFGRGPSKDHSTKVWLQLAQWFMRRRLKCEMLTDGRRTKSDDNSSHGLKARWAKKGNNSKMGNQIYFKIAG